MEFSHYMILLSQFKEKYEKEQELKKTIREKYNLKENVHIKLLFVNPEHNFAGYLFKKNYVYWTPFQHETPKIISIETDKLTNVSFITEYEKQNYEKYNIKEKEFEVSTVAIIDETNNNLLFLFSALSEKFSLSEIQLLSSVCQCSIHQMSWYNPCKYISCKCCYGCLDSCFELCNGNQSNDLILNTIQKTRQMLNVNEYKKHYNVESLY